MFIAHYKTFKMIAALAALALLAAGCAAPTAPPAAKPPAETPAQAAEATQAPAEAPAATETPAPTEAPQAGAANTVVIARAEDTVSLDPGRAFETMTGMLHKATYQTLVTFPDDSASEIKPLLAEKWDISTDGKVYTFTLSKDAKFSDGTPVTAKDVAFSIMRMKNIKGNPSSLAGNIKSVEAADDATAMLTLENPDPSILAQLVNSRV